MLTGNQIASQLRRRAPEIAVSGASFYYEALHPELHCTSLLCRRWVGKPGRHETLQQILHLQFTSLLRRSWWASRLL